MRFDLENLNPGKKFFLDEDDESQGFVCVRTLSPEERTRIVKATRSEVVKLKRGKPFTSVKVDNERHDQMIWDYCVEDWEIYDKKGEKIPCTADNKFKMMNGSPTFAGMVAGFLEIVANIAIEEEEAAEKN